jgi:sirohydrochlorin ferrochelatase
VQKSTNRRTHYAFLEHNQPSVTTALNVAADESGEPIETVGLFLSAGHHVRVDVPTQIAQSKVSQVSQTGHLGIGPWLIAALEDQLAALHMPRADGIAAIAAGSTNPEARDEVIALASTWQRDRAIPVRPAFASGEGPSISEALEMLTDAHCNSRVIALLMLAPGVLADRVIDAGRDHDIPVTAPLVEGAAIVDRISELTLQP